MRTLPLVFTLAAATAPTPALVRAQEATASLEVTVRQGSVPVAGQEVSVEAPGLRRRALTDERGRANFDHLPPGSVTTRAQGPQARAESQVRLDPGTRCHVRLEVWPGEAQAPEAEAAHEPSALPGRVFSSEDLRDTPRPADPWSLALDVPGVTVDRVNVGGSETAQQSLLVSHGDNGSGAAWTLDGVDVTDPSAVGFTTVFPDLGSLSQVELRTSALDVRVRTPGVQISLLSRAPADRFSGAARLRGTGDALQADNLPSDLRSRRLARGRTERLLELGAEAGGPLRQGRLWLWGSAARAALTQEAFTEHEERLSTTWLAAKGRLSLGGGTLSLLALRSEKVHEDRDPTRNAAPEARWRQSGPTYLLAAEGQHSFGRASLLARLAYLDAGFRLEPRGGAAPDAFEDFRGVFRGSYYSFNTRRPRLQAGLEAARHARWLGLDHDLLLGVGYRRSLVTTQLAWPGNKVLGLERQSLFFRTFRLSGFALATRDLNGRSLEKQLDAYAQDTLRLGRFRLALGARLDRLTGRNLASSVAANPAFPGLLPAVEYAGDAPHIRWLDLLPRAGLTWDATDDGRVVAGLAYAAYGGPFSAADVAFDNPVGRDYASLAYYWNDRDGDHAVEPGELDTLRGRLAASGLDPRDPGSTVSPHRIAPGLRAPRTHELAASAEESFGSALTLGVRASFRRTSDLLWRPLRGLARSDYLAAGSVRGELHGQPYDVVFFVPASVSRIVPGNGRLLANREGYRQDAATLTATARGRIGGRGRWEAWGSWTEWRESFDDPERAVQDPTPLDTEPLRDEGPVAARPAGLGRGDVFVNARWTAGVALHAGLPLRLEAAALLHARQGFPVPYFEVVNTSDPTGGAKNVLVAPALDTYRLPSLLLVDARLARGVALGRGTLTAALEVFNLLNRATTLQVARDVELPAGRPREILRPRIARLGIEYAF